MHPDNPFVGQHHLLDAPDHIRIGRLPEQRDTASRTMEKPDQITNSATAAPTYPSTATPVPHPTREDKSTTPVQITSFRLSVAAAFRVSGG